MWKYSYQSRKRRVWKFKKRNEILHEKEQERAKQNLISQNASKEENKEEEERKGIPVVPPLQIDEDGIALGKVSLTNFNKKPQ